MSKGHRDKGSIEGPFVPLLVNTMKSKAWRTMSPYASRLYIALKARYSFKIKNNGRIYLSARTAAEETGFNKSTVVRAFHELAHYGFIVMTEPGCLGLNGRGKAPHWRLTELGYMGDPPTRDFMRWDGTVFCRPKKQNPVRPDGTDCTAGRDIPVYGRTVQSPAKVYGPAVHTDEPSCTAGRDISSLTTWVASERSAPHSAVASSLADRNDEKPPHGAVASVPSKTAESEAPRPPRTPEQQSQIDVQVEQARRQLGIPPRRRAQCGIR
jgi:hypothetical protein